MQDYVEVVTAAPKLKIIVGFVNSRYGDVNLMTRNDVDDGASSTGRDATSAGPTDASALFDDTEPILVYSTEYPR